MKLNYVTNRARFFFGEREVPSILHHMATNIIVSGDNITECPWPATMKYPRGKTLTYLCGEVGGFRQ